MTLSPELSIEELLALAEEARAEISALKFTSKKGEEFSITISGGIAAIPEHATSLERLMMKTDDALYQAKDSGRNRILIYSPKKAKG